MTWDLWRSHGRIFAYCMDLSLLFIVLVAVVNLWVVILSLAL